MTTNRLMEEALRLPPQKRVELVDRLLDSLDRPDPEIDALWLHEAESRLEAYRRGEMKAVSLDEVLQHYIAREWDEQIERDIHDGKLDRLAKDAQADRRAGKSSEL